MYRHRLYRKRKFSSHDNTGILLFIIIIPQCCDLLEGLIPKDDKDATGLRPVHYERLFVFTLMWSIGAFLELDDRSKIEDWLRHSEETEKKLDLPVIPSDSDATMFDYMVDHNGGCRA